MPNDSTARLIDNDGNADADVDVNVDGDGDFNIPTEAVSQEQLASQGNPIAMEQSPIGQLPEDLFIYICSFLEAGDLLAATRVCHAWYRILTDDYTWREAFLTQFGQSLPFRFVLPHPIKSSADQAASIWRPKHQQLQQSPSASSISSFSSSDATTPAVSEVFSAGMPWRSEYLARIALLRRWAAHRRESKRSMQVLRMRSNSWHAGGPAGDGLWWINPDAPANGHCVLALGLAAGDLDTGAVSIGARPATSLSTSLARPAPRRIIGCGVVMDGFVSADLPGANSAQRGQQLSSSLQTRRIESVVTNRDNDTFGGGVVTAARVLSTHVLLGLGSGDAAVHWLVDGQSTNRLSDVSARSTLFRCNTVAGDRKVSHVARLVKFSKMFPAGDVDSIKIASEKVQRQLRHMFGSELQYLNTMISSTAIPRTAVAINEYLVVARVDGSVALYCMKHGDLVKTLSIPQRLGPQRSVEYLEVLHGSQMVVAALPSGIILVWDLANNLESCEGPSHGEVSSVEPRVCQTSVATPWTGLIVGESFIDGQRLPYALVASASSPNVSAIDLLTGHVLATLDPPGGSTLAPVTALSSDQTDTYSLRQAYFQAGFSSTSESTDVAWQEYCRLVHGPLACWLVVTGDASGCVGLWDVMKHLSKEQARRIALSKSSDPVDAQKLVVSIQHPLSISPVRYWSAPADLRGSLRVLAVHIDTLKCTYYLQNTVVIRNPLDGQILRQIKVRTPNPAPAWAANQQNQQNRDGRPEWWYSRPLLETNLVTLALAVSMRESVSVWWVGYEQSDSNRSNSPSGRGRGRSSFVGGRAARQSQKQVRMAQWDARMEAEEERGRIEDEQEARLGQIEFERNFGGIEGLTEEQQIQLAMMMSTDSNQEHQSEHQQQTQTDDVNTMSEEEQIAYALMLSQSEQ
ncbi:hypothetical protein GQ42DRAFT_163287 [Ramicandelaber brevisporus]|nr:hypothetical protein GQ42DRAFT_163287 [Ramicandelaber brevisporus]